MQANTKLTDFQKTELKEYREFSPATILNLDNKTTMAYQVRGNTVEFALSVMAPTEKKFRRKVGEYFAYDKFTDNQTVKMDKFDFMAMCEAVWDAYPIE